MKHTMLRSITGVTAALAMTACVAQGQITGGGISSSVSAPGSGSAGNSVRVSSSPDLIKFVGDIDLTSSRGGSSVGNTLDIAGDVTLNADEAFTLAYDYNVSLLGGGTVTLTATAITDFGGVTETLTSTETITEPGDFNFTFTELGFVATETVSGTWTGQLAFDWIDAPAESSLSIVIPNESIDFMITAIPEPSSLLLAFGAAALACSRRR